MNLKDAWKKLELDKLEIAKPSVINPWATKSQHPVEKLKRAYLYSTIFSIIFLACFILLFFLFREWIVRLGLAVTIIIYILFVYFNFKMYRHIKIDVLFDSNLRIALKNTHQFITANIRFQERFALFVYPFAGAAGMLMGLATGGGSAEKYLSEKFVIALLIVVPLLLTPLCWLFARWLYKISYGVCLAELKKLIEEMER
ncbi:MAG: hypothetical protein ACKO96_02155 [Flammeovirgaceae bacterium]